MTTNKKKSAHIIKFEDLKIGQHLWVLLGNELVMVAKFDEYGYEVCGAWECGISKNDCEIIKLVPFPKGYENTKLYYAGS